jgi:hypothetical protein
MNKAIILFLILTTLFQLFSQKKTGIYYEYDEEDYEDGAFKTVYTPQEDYDAAAKTYENGDCVYTDCDDKDKL